MIVACMFSGATPNEVQLAYGAGAGTLQLVTAARLLQEVAEDLLRRDPEDLPPGRGETGDAGPFKDVSPDDVCVTVCWADPAGPPEVDYRIARAATPDHLRTCALALDEYVRFGIWNSRMGAQLDLAVQMQRAQQQERERAAAAIARVATLPPNRPGRA